MSSIPLILLAVLMSVSGQTLLKTGMTRVGVVGRADLSRPVDLAGRLVLQPRVVGGLSIYVASAFVWIYVLANTELSYAYPFLALSYVAVTATAVFALKERYAWYQWIGVVLVVVGVAVVAFSAR